MYERNIFKNNVKKFWRQIEKKVSIQKNKNPIHLYSPHRRYNAYGVKDMINMYNVMPVDTFCVHWKRLW